jgi:hypothetical protein
MGIKKQYIHMSQQMLNMSKEYLTKAFIILSEKRIENDRGRKRMQHIKSEKQLNSICELMFKLNSSIGVSPLS